MSSEHYIIVARHYETGKIELPLDDLTLYGGEPEGEEELFQWVCKQYDEDWTLAVYAPKGGFYGGQKK